MPPLANPTDEVRFHANGIQSESKYESIAHLVEEWTKRTPGAPAVCQGDRCWTYSQLTASASALAASFPTGEVVAVTGQQSFGLVAGMLAVLSNRSVLLTIDSNLPEHRQQLLVKQAGARHLFVAGKMPSWMHSHPWNNVIQVDPDYEAASHTSVLAASSPGDPAYIFFTSGSTGAPKGVLGTQKGLSHFLTWQSSSFRVAPGDRVAQLTNLSFDVVLRSVFLALVSGGTLCFPPESLTLTGSSVLPWMEREKITLIHTVPSLGQAWLTDVPAGISLPDLRLVFFAGEPLQDSLVRRWRAKFPSGQIVNLYGPTETTLAKFFYKVPAEPDPGIQPVGWPLPETEALLLDEHGARCGAGEVGEIVVRTPFRTLGYINAPEEQEKRFVRNPFRDDPMDLLYRTGDLGRYRSDGALEILGRLDHQVKIQGVRIEPGEVSGAISRHPRVQSCVVVAQMGPVKEPVLVAYVVGAGLSAMELREHLRAELPIAMIPAAFVFLERLPLNPNGKVDRGALPVHSVANSFVAPRTQLEQTLASLWQEVLGVDKIGLEDNFFELGGNSLGLTQLHAKLRTWVNRDILLTELFQHPTVRALAGFLTPQAPKKSAVLTARQRAARQIAARSGQAPEEE